jgi:protein tyrosine/serine phosphatase
MGNAKIKTIINLSDNTKSLKNKIIFCPYYKMLYECGNTIAANINMTFDLTEDIFCKKIRNALLFMVTHDPPYMIHCEAGIDRTGFFSILLESFMGAEFNDIVKDYMLSFVDNGEYSENDYRNGSVFITSLFTKIKGELTYPGEDLPNLSRKYLAEKIGLNDSELDRLRTVLMFSPACPGKEVRP